MADPNAAEKDEAEEELMAVLLLTLEEQLQLIEEGLDEPPDVGDISGEFWEAMILALLLVVRPRLERMAIGAAQQVIVAGGVGVDWVTVAERATEWASSYSYELVRDITATTRRVLGRKIGQFLREPGRAMGELYAELRPYFGDMRAELIGVTETTRAYVQGMELTRQEAERMGLNLEHVWHTMRDERVCPVCGARDGKPQREWPMGDLPPAHPRCRCWTTLRWVV